MYHCQRLQGLARNFQNGRRLELHSRVKDNSPQLAFPLQCFLSVTSIRMLRQNLHRLQALLLHLISLLLGGPQLSRPPPTAATTMATHPPHWFQPCQTVASNPFNHHIWAADLHEMTNASCLRTNLKTLCRRSSRALPVDSAHCIVTQV